MTIGLPPLRARMSGAESRFCACWAGAAWVDMSGPVCRRSEHLYPDHQRVEREGKGEKQDNADDDRADIVLPPADRNRRSARVAAALERDAIIDRPGQHRSEQDDAAEITIGDEMRDRPRFHAHQHRMLQPALDLARAIGRLD